MKKLWGWNEMYQKLKDPMGKKEKLHHCCSSFLRWRLKILRPVRFPSLDVRRLRRGWATFVEVRGEVKMTPSFKTAYQRRWLRWLRLVSTRRELDIARRRYWSGAASRRWTNDDGVSLMADWRNGSDQRVGLQVGDHKPSISTSLNFVFNLLIKQLTNIIYSN